MITWANFALCHDFRPHDSVLPIDTHSDFISQRTRLPFFYFLQQLAMHTAFATPAFPTFSTRRQPARQVVSMTGTSPPRNAARSGVAQRRRPVLIADVMGTLVRDPFFHGMASHFGFDTFASFLSAKAPGVWPEFELGRVDESTLAQSFFRDGRAMNVTALKKFMVETYTLLPGIAELLGALTCAEVEVHLCTNYPAWTDMIEDATGLEKKWGARWTFISAAQGLRKPDRAAYERTAMLAGVDVGRCIMLDDREDNCEAATECGFLAAVRFETAKQAAAELAEVLAKEGVMLEVDAVV